MFQNNTTSVREINAVEEGSYFETEFEWKGCVESAAATNGATGWREKNKELVTVTNEF